MVLTLGSLCRKMSILFKNKTIDVLENHRELITESKRAIDSASWFWVVHLPCEPTKVRIFALDVHSLLLPSGHSRSARCRK